MATTQDQERQIIDALLAIGETETRELLWLEGLLVVQGVLGPSIATALRVLHDLEARRLVTPDINRDGQLDTRKRWRWVRPSN
jgi:hypothetical protein